jgi:hypothetical protein
MIPFVLLHITTETDGIYTRIASLVRGLAGADEALKAPATAVRKIRVGLPVNLRRSLLKPLTSQFKARHLA